MALRGAQRRGGGAKGVFTKTHYNYSNRFPEGVQKEELQQWRQARSRPGEKETHNIKLRENSHEIRLKRGLQQQCSSRFPDGVQKEEIQQ